MSDSGNTADLTAEVRRIMHDLRQPLAAMQMWVDLLAERLRGQLGEREERYLAKIRAEMARMTALVASPGSVPAAALPRAEEAGAPREGERPSLAGISLLVVEDDLMTAEALQVALEGEGASVVVAETLAAALGTLADAAPHGVLSDLRLSDGDGFALVTEIRRRDAAAGRTTAALAVTGFDSAETRRASRAAGFDDLVVKPFVLDELIERIARLVSR